MSTAYPAAQDSFNNPSASLKLNDAGVPHAQQHSDANDALEALEAKLGIGASTPVANVFLIGNGVGTSAWTKAAPTGTVVGNSDSQTLTNKTLDNTNTLTLLDSLFTLQDNGGTTRQGKFELSGITAGQTRTLTWPDASTTLVGTDVAQTLTNKTLTTPTIASFTNAQHDHSNAAGGGVLTHTGLPNGVVVQVVSTVSGVVATGTTTVPEDDTIPQNTEGDQYMTITITPKTLTNRLFITAHAFVSQSLNTNNAIIGALFQDSTVNALAAVDQFSNVASAGYHIYLTHDMVAATISATTFKLRIGPVNASTVTFNGFGGARKFGGVTLSSISVIEYKA